jgi:hypothetical protein
MHNALTNLLTAAIFHESVKPALNETGWFFSLPDISLTHFLITEADGYEAFTSLTMHRCKNINESQSAVFHP